MGQTGKASHFYPEIVDAFIEIVEEFRASASRYNDSDKDLN